MHTSTVTVAVMPLDESQPQSLREEDLTWETKRGSGAGGQHRNKTESAVRMVHTPTGLAVDVCSERSQHQNRRIARALLEARVHERMQARSNATQRQARRAQVGSGMRGDKVRTYRTQDGVVIHHASGRKGALKKALDGVLP